LTKDDNGPAYRNIWKAKIPEKNEKLYVVGCSRSYILTKDNMLRRLAGAWMLLLWCNINC
jgi:hypothetical protein